MLGGLGIRATGKVKGCFPFRVGTTSYIIPDDILPNVRFLAGQVDDIQLILFESDEITNLPSPKVIQELAAIGRDENLTYTVHFPMDVYLGADDAAERHRSLGKCQRIIDLCEPLDVMTYALHLAPADPDDRRESPAVNLATWQAACNASLSILTRAVPSPRQLCIETLAYRFDVVDPLLEQHDLGVCLDIGHLLLGGYDVCAHLKKYRDRLHLMHIHGVQEGRDHHSLRHLDPALLTAAIQTMAGGDAYRVMTVEIFNETDFQESMAVLEAYEA